jgi:hypothetical protein
MLTSPLPSSGFIYGSQEHHLDHLAPLCALLNIPLIVTDETLLSLAKEYYPGLTVFFISPLEVAFYLLERFPILFTTMPAPMVKALFLLNQNSPLTIWCPHGNSDKGQNSFFMEALKEEKILLLYGNKMQDFLKEKEALSKESMCFFVGNYRYLFYKQHRLFYQTLCQQLLSKLPPSQPTYLYAPTWQDHEKVSSFSLALPHLLETLPSTINLIIKLHPNTLLKDNLSLEKLRWKYEDKPNILFLERFPPIYPLLEAVDLYIGDTSSIGYDFLSFNKPMFFLDIEDSPTSRYLYQCGPVFKKKDFPSIYSLIQLYLKDEEVFSPLRKAVYNYTFADNEVSSKLLENIYPLYSTFSYAP